MGLHGYFKLDGECMNRKLEEIEEEERVKAPFIPRIITGGKDPTDPNDPNWLSSLDQYTSFLVQNKKDTQFALGEFRVIYKSIKSILVLSSNMKEPIWVDPIRFCRDFRLHEILQTGEEYLLEQKAREQLDGE